MITAPQNTALQYRCTPMIVAIAGGIFGFALATTWNHWSHLTPNLFCVLIFVWAVAVIAVQRHRAAGTLKQAHDRLEQEVAERTAELSDANQSLQQEMVERKRVENELWRSNMDLQQFAYVAAHDLKQPLRSTALCLEFLDKDSSHDLDPDGQEYLGLALSSARRMSALVGDLLELAKVNRREQQSLNRSADFIPTMKFPARESAYRCVGGSWKTTAVASGSNPNQAVAARSTSRCQKRRARTAITTWLALP